MVGTKQNELTGLGLYPGSLQDRTQRDALPEAVARKTIHRAAVPRALEPKDQLTTRHRLKVSERESQWPVHESRHSQSVRRRVDLGVPVMLRCEELVTRGEHPVDRSDIDDPPIRCPLQREGLGQVSKGYQGLFLGEDRKRPFR